jgi:hypothetical protein
MPDSNDARRPDRFWMATTSLRRYVSRAQSRGPPVAYPSREERVITMFRRTALALAVCALTSSEATAQSAQSSSLQASVLLGAMNWNGHQQAGIGAEGQFRFNHVAASANGVLSIGIGGQYTHHSFADGDINITGAFVEPRYAFAVTNGRFFPYIAGRLALLQQSGNTLASSSGYAAGGGGGFAIVLSPNVNLDLGAAALYQGFSDTKVSASGATVTFSPSLSYAVKLGLSFGL